MAISYRIYMYITIVNRFKHNGYYNQVADYIVCFNQIYLLFIR